MSSALSSLFVLQLVRLKTQDLWFFCRFSLSPPSSGAGRRVRRVHFLAPSGQSPQLLLRPAGQTLNNAPVGVHASSSLCSITSSSLPPPPAGSDGVLLRRLSGSGSQHPHDHAVRQRGGGCGEQGLVMAHAWCLVLSEAAVGLMKTGSVMHSELPAAAGNSCCRERTF